MTVTGDDPTATLQFDEEDASLGDDQCVDFVYRAVVADEFEVCVDENRITIRQGLTEEIEGLALGAYRDSVNCFQRRADRGMGVTIATTIWRSSFDFSTMAGGNTLPARWPRRRTTMSAPLPCPRRSPL